MTSGTRREVFADKAATGRAVARAAADRLAAAQRAGGDGHLVLTGGSMGGVFVESLVELADRSDGSGPDYSRVHVWWGDERFLPSGDPDRNDTQAAQAGLGRLGLDPARVHRMPGPDAPTGDDLAAAAQAYAEELAGVVGHEAPCPAFDVLLLGVGPDGHVASLFPHHEAQRGAHSAVVGVTESPKPPPRRLSLTYPALCGARAAWFIVAGEDKANAVRAAADADPWDIPAAGVRGQEETVWWLDAAAAGGASTS